MPQNTNLNVSPYFDDFDEKKGYQKVLFKPGTPIQSRELTTLQSILQNQIEKFGNHFFKEGAIVIPGQIGYDSEYNYVKIDDTHLGIPVSAYIDKFVGKTIKGEKSGVTAVVENYITSSQSETKTYTLYVKYTKSSDVNFTQKTFVDGENLISLENVDYSLSSVRANTSFATSIILNSTGKGSASKIEEGVYFIRGFFVTVTKQTIILDQYSNTPTYRIGLLINEEIAVASNNYKDLYDNAKGFSNYAAPGADRLKISLSLIKKEIDDFNDQDFVELLRVENGNLIKIVEKSNYNLIRDELARRTYDESGDYYIKPFDVNVKESLNDRVGNNGVYFSNQKTSQGKVPSKDLSCLSISPGKAYVRGFEIETINNTIVDVEKPRTTERAENQSIPFNIGRQILVNNVRGSLPVGFGTTSQISLYSDRTATTGISSGTKIGVARVYDLKLKNTEYSDATTEFECSLFDIQTYTKLTINTSITQTAPAYIQGKNSGAKGYLVSTVSSLNTLTLYQVSGSFIANEQIKINGLDVSRTITSVTDYSLTDVHQLVGNESVSGVSTFTADPVLTNLSFVADTSTQFTITSGGTVTTSNQNFYVGIKVGDIVSYTKQSESVPTYNKVSSISTSGKSLTIIPTTSVSGICSGSLPGSTITVNDFKIARLEVLNTNNAFLYSKLNNNNISNLDLTGSDIVFKKSYNIAAGEFSDGSWSATLETDTSLTFEPFDEEDYNLTFYDGTVVPLSDQKLVPSSRSIEIKNITPNSGSAVLIATLKKINTKTRKKIYNRNSTLTIDKTSSGISTSISGLSQSSIYGLRVEDEEISLNVCDVESVIGVFESSTTSSPVLPSFTLTGLNSNILNSIKGERIVGKDTGAVASLVSNDGTNQVFFVYLNENSFSVGESVTFEESQISGIVDSINIGDKNIKDNFILDEGQRSEYLDFSRLIRKPSVSAPTKKITIVYNYYTIDSSDNGDFVGVNSYDKDRYDNDISSVDGISLSDIIDLRPRVSPYSGTKSPFEYESRDFTGQNSSKNILAQEKSINLSYDYYLPRIDKLFLTKEGSFILNKGVPSLNPKLPGNLDSCMEVATIRLPAYLRKSEDAKVILAPHKRYTMKDISRLEDRISNVEYYTSLSLLESDTKNLMIRDTTTKLDRFKCGFFVDNFKSYNGGQTTNKDYKASIDVENGILRPSHYTTSLDLLLGSESIIGIGTQSNPDADLRFVTDLSSPNIKRIGDIVCLNYTEVEYTKNQFATRSENVNPFNVINWIGSIQLNPSSDTWTETRKTARTYDIEGSYSSTIQQLGVDSNTGLSPIDWSSWETNWTGRNITNGPVLGRLQTGSEVIGSSSYWSGPFVVTDDTIRDDFIEFRNQTVTNTGTQTRQGIQFKVNERFDTTNLGDKVVSREIITTMRSRNIEIISKRLKPSSRLYAFFDNVDMTSYVIPKLIEISMISGSFSSGETVIGVLGTKSIRFRLATQNHKYGPYNSPTETYSENPYSPENSLSSSYSSTSTLLNVDTASLELQASSGFFGCIAKNMQLVGQSSGAVANVSDIKIVTDSSGVFIGSLFIPDPTIPSAPLFNTGTKTFVLTSSSTNSTIVTSDETTAESNFTSAGTLDNVENSTLRIRNANVERIPQSDSRSITNTETNLVTTNTSTTRTSTSTRWVDPLAQSFEVADNNGVFITKCDIFFKTKDTKGIPVTLQIRTMENGTPTQTILPFAEVTLDPKNVNVSEDGSVATTFSFPSPVYLEKVGSGYAIALVSSSDSYNVWISRMGEIDVSTTNKPDAEKIIVSKQPSLGALFKSQNGSTWTPSDYEDLKFTLYRADFVTQPSSFRLYNPDLDLGNNQIVSLRQNPLNFYSNSALIGIGTSLSSIQQDDLVVGNTISQTSNTNFSAKLKSLVGSVGINSTLTLTNVGSGFTAGPKLYSNINLISLTGFGKNAKVDLNVSGGVAIAATITDGGTGYAVGDTLTISPTSTDNLGKNLILTIPNNVGIITAVNSLIVEGIQGKPNTTNTLTITNNGSAINAATINDSVTINDGLHFKVNHQNHGMYSSVNKVTLSGVEPDSSPVKLTADYSSTSTDSISLDSIGTLGTFENVAVDSNNPGYVIIDNEIIRYTGTSGNTLTGITGGRGIDGTISTLHLKNAPVFKYELNGISLRRINKTHTFADVDLNKYPIELDSYHIKISQKDSGTDRSTGNSNSYPELFSKETKSGGTYLSFTNVNSLRGAKATQNITFNNIRPNIQTLLPETTSIDGKIRTVTGTSVDGNEISFIDKRFEDVSLNSTNVLSDTRLICSKVNEIDNLSILPGKKSFTMELTLSTGDKKVSPMIDLHRVNIITTMNRIDNPVLDFTLDPRVNQLSGDPNSAIYVSKIVKLQKSADNLKVLFDAYRHSTNDIRVMYRLLRNDTPDSQQLYEFFPGYDNLDQNGNVIDKSKNNGKSDRFVQASNTLNDFGNYEFTANNLALFNGFQIKIIMTGTNQSYVPLLRDLRVIATI